MISWFNFRITHRAGKLHGAADGLTRTTTEVKDSDDNRNVVVLRPEHFVKLSALHFAEASGNDLADEIRSESRHDAEVLEGLRNLKQKGLRRMLDGSVDWEIEDGLIRHQGKVYVPDSAELRRKVVKSCHDALTAGHPGRSGTLELVSRSY